MTIGGNHSEVCVCQLEFSAVQCIARLLIRDGKGGAADEGSDHFSGNGEVLAIKHRDFREVIFGQAEHLETRPFANDAHLFILALFYFDLRLWQGSHNLKEFFGLQTDRAFPFDLGGALRRDGDIQVSALNPQFPIFGFEQQIGEDRNRALLLHHSLDKIQFFQKGGFADGQMH